MPLNGSENELSSHKGKLSKLQRWYKQWAQANNTVFPEQHCYPNTYWSLLPAVAMVISLHSTATYFLSLVGLLTDSHPQINPRLQRCSIHHNLTENSIFLFSVLLSLHSSVPLSPAFLFNFSLILAHCVTFCLVSFFSHFWLHLSLVFLSPFFQINNFTGSVSLRKNDPKTENKILIYKKQHTCLHIQTIRTWFSIQVKLSLFLSFFVTFSVGSFSSE